MKPRAKCRLNAVDHSHLFCLCVKSKSDIWHCCNSNTIKKLEDFSLPPSISDNCSNRGWSAAKICYLLGMLWRENFWQDIFKQRTAVNWQDCVPTPQFTYSYKLVWIAMCIFKNWTLGSIYLWLSRQFLCIRNRCKISCLNLQKFHWAIFFNNVVNYREAYWNWKVFADS